MCPHLTTQPFYESAEKCVQPARLENLDQMVILNLDQPVVEARLQPMVERGIRSSHGDRSDDQLRMFWRGGELVPWYRTAANIHSAGHGIPVLLTLIQKPGPLPISGGSWLFKFLTGFSTLGWLGNHRTLRSLFSQAGIGCAVWYLPGNDDPSILGDFSPHAPPARS